MARYSIYGFTLETDHPMVAFLDASEEEPDLRFTCGEGQPHPAGEPALIYESGIPGPGDEGIFSLYRLEDEGGYLLRYPGSAAFFIFPERIHCELLNPEDAYWVEIALLGPVLSFWLELRGIVALHASAVAVGEAGIGFVAGTKAGKTALAASFVEAGARLLSDDILPVHPISPDGRLVARPGYPQLRMWPDQAVRFAGDPKAYPLAHPDFDKRRIPASRIGGFHSGTVPLTALFFPTRVAAATSPEVSLTRVAGPEALVLLARASFAASVLERMPEMQVRRLKMLAEIVSSVGVYRLIYPEGYESLGAVRRAVIDELAPSGKGRGSSRASLL